MADKRKSEKPKRKMSRRVMLVPPLGDLKVAGRDIGPKKNAESGEVEWDGPTAAINGALAEYAYLLERAARELEPVLTRAEWNAVADVMNGCADLFDYGGPQTNPLQMVAANLEDSPGIGGKWGVDVADLRRRLGSLTPTHGYAIIAAVRWFWTHHDAIDHETEVWWAVEFRKASHPGARKINPRPTEIPDSLADLIRPLMDEFAQRIKEMQDGDRPGGGEGG